MTVAFINGLKQLNLPLYDMTEFGKLKLPKFIVFLPSKVYSLRK